MIKEDFLEEAAGSRVTLLAPGTGNGVGRREEDMAQAVKRVMGSDRGSFASSPAAHLLLCSLVPNRPLTGTGPW